MFLWKLLTSVEEGITSSLSDSSSAGGNPSFWSKYGMMIMLGGLFLLLILGMFWSSRKRRKQQEEAVEKINALKPGTKVETIGGVFGTIVEMDREEGTFVLETGSEKHGKTYIRFDRNAIARIEPTANPVAGETFEQDEAPEFEPAADNAETEENKD